MEKASWTKGRQGDWLVRAEAGLAGKAIEVAKKAGGSSTVTLAREIWSKDGVALYGAAVRPLPARRR